jgi:hypothetical protein
MKECDNSKIHISSNFILSISLLIMLDTLLLRPLLHCNTPLHFITLHPTTLHYISPHFTTLHPVVAYVSWLYSECHIRGVNDIWKVVSFFLTTRDLLRPYFLICVSVNYNEVYFILECGMLKSYETLKLLRVCMKSIMAAVRVCFFSELITTI